MHRLKIIRYILYLLSAAASVRGAYYSFEHKTGWALAMIGSAIVFYGLAFVLVTAEQRRG